MIKQLNFGMVNAYLITGDKGSVLVDTGYPKSKDKLIPYLKDIDLKLIILTHGHIDHIANAKYISQQFDVPIAMHKGDCDLDKVNNLRKIHADNLFGYLLKLVSCFSPNSKIDKFVPQILLEDGMCLEECGIPIKVYELKGHTDGSIGLLVGTKVMIVGDTMMNVIRPTRARIYNNKKDLKNSIKIIKNTGVKTIFPGHGKPIYTNH
jgi:hydroxyacylglutathione hydrolase